MPNRVIFDTDAGSDIDDLWALTSPAYLTITDSIHAEALKQRYVDLVFNQ